MVAGITRQAAMAPRVNIREADRITDVNSIVKKAGSTTRLTPDDGLETLGDARPQL